MHPSCIVSVSPILCLKVSAFVTGAFVFPHDRERIVSNMKALRRREDAVAHSRSIEVHAQTKSLKAAIKTAATAPVATCWEIATAAPVAEAEALAPVAEAELEPEAELPVEAAAEDEAAEVEEAEEASAAEV